MAQHNQSEKVSPGGLDDVLARAHAERWESLTLIGPGFPSWAYPSLRATEHAIQIPESPEKLVAKLTSLTSLTSLKLAGIGIGADGARALAALTNLTSLDLRSNSIGAGGARAFAALTNLTSLDLRSNSIKTDGARAPRRADQPHFARSER